MQWGIVLKYIDQKLPCQSRIDQNTCILVFSKCNILLDNNQRTGLYLTHINRSCNELIDRMIVDAFQMQVLIIPRQNICKDLLSSQFFQCTSKLWLEQNDHRDNADTDRVTEYPQDRIQTKKGCQSDKDKQHNNSFEQGPCTRLFKPDHDMVNYIRQNNDLNNVRHMDLRYVKPIKIYT